MAGEPRIELVNRRQVCRNAQFDVFLDEIVDEHGRRVSDYLSVVPLRADADGVTGIAVLPVRADGCFGLTCVFRHPQGSAAWEIVKGFIDASETPVEAARRELAEETGLAAAHAAIVDLGYLCPVPGVIKAKVRLFAALDVMPSGGGDVGEIGHGAPTFFTREAFFEMADSSAIEEPCTLLAAYRYLRHTGSPEKQQ
jgi:8-oxo-dGTP pyrophosphatase MutT (NUDIX family)